MCERESERVCVRGRASSPGALGGETLRELLRQLAAEHHVHGDATTLETTQGRIDGFLSQISSKCYPPEVASVGD